MCENIVIVSTAQQVRDRYHLKMSNSYLPIPTPSVLSGGDKVWVITSKNPGILQQMTFGYTSENSEKRMELLNLRTAPMEMDEEDHEYDEYDRLMNIFIRPRFVASIHAYRCAVLADAFLVNSPDNTTYLIHMQNNERPFALAGLYSQWIDPQTGVKCIGFALLTAAANPMLRRIDVEHMPVILLTQNVNQWLDLTLPLRKVLPLIHTFPDNAMNGYPVSGKIFSGQLTNRVLQPIGSRLNKVQIIKKGSIHDQMHK